MKSTMKIATWAGLSGVAAFAPTAASADIIVTNVNSGFTNNYTAAIGSDSLGIAETGFDGPYDLYYYGSNYSGYDAAYYGYNLNITGSPNLLLAPGGLVGAGTIVGPGGTYAPTETALTSQYNGYVYDGSYSEIVGYGDCGKNCEYPIYDTYYYQDVGYTGPNSSGSWLNAVNDPGYIGLELTDGGQTNYGWAEFGLDSTGGSDLEVNLIAFGIETNPGQSIVAGATTDADPVPEPGTLTLFAAGCAGLLRLRKNRKSSGQ